MKKRRSKSPLRLQALVPTGRPNAKLPDQAAPSHSPTATTGDGSSAAAQATTEAAAADTGAHPSARTLLIEPRDPVLVRDARPFSSDPGARAFTLPWPWPRTVAKTIRSLIGSGYQDTTWTPERREEMARMAVHGPLMVAKVCDGADELWEVYVPAPRDVVFHRNADEAGIPMKVLDSMILRPTGLDEGEGFLAPPTPTSAPGVRGEAAYANLVVDKNGLPAVVGVTADVKPETDVPAWWRLADALQWLEFAGEANAPEARSHLPLNRCDREIGEMKQVVNGLSGPLTDARTHVSIETGTQTNVEGALFTTEALAFPGGHLKAELAERTIRTQADRMAMLVRLTSAPDTELPTAIALGGERRISLLSDVQAKEITKPGWSAPVHPAGWESARGLRIQLVTPAIFQFGWLPAWVADGTIPGLRGCKIHLELVGAVTDRRQAVSGWFSQPRNTTRNPHATPLAYSANAEAASQGPAATDYVVPAGSVYFFRLAQESGPLTSDVWNKLWLAPVSDLEISRNQGFGLVLPGIWDPSSLNDTHTKPHAQEETR